MILSHIFSTVRTPKSHLFVALAMTVPAMALYVPAGMHKRLSSKQNNQGRAQSDSIPSHRRSYPWESGSYEYSMALLFIAFKKW
jgi:hypothetical protein